MNCACAEFLNRLAGSYSLTEQVSDLDFCLWDSMESAAIRYDSAGELGLESPGHLEPKNDDELVSTEV